MMNYYLGIKHLHMTAATLSILFFVVRAYWSVTCSPLLQRRAVRTLPHIIDTVLLACGLLLAWLLGSAAMQPWLLTKMTLLVVYILVGSYAIKHGPTPRARGIAAVIAVAIFLYIVGAAMRRSALSWFV